MFIQGSQAGGRLIKPGQLGASRVHSRDISLISTATSGKSFKCVLASGRFSKRESGFSVRIYRNSILPMNTPSRPHGHIVKIT